MCSDRVRIALSTQAFVTTNQLRLKPDRHGPAIVGGGVLAE
jgi:hypothetical protein